MNRPVHPRPEDRQEVGRAARKAVPRSAHAELDRAGRADPVGLLAEQNETRVDWLVPVRHGRMVVSAFTFYRGAARVMAHDLARTPTSGLTVQAGGDAHLSNFGGYASPDRKFVFDQNDFDETLPGPWEWDVKRLATSFAIGGHDSGFDAGVCRDLAEHVVESYRTAMARFAEMRVLDVWYERLEVSSLGDVLGPLSKRQSKRLERFERKARGRDSLQALEKLAVEVDGRYQIRHDPPTLLRLRDLPGAADGEALEALAFEALETYVETLPDERKHLYRRFTPIDVGVKVVGVGSVGTRCFIVLLEGRDRSDPLFLQIKEATRSVLEDHLTASAYDHHGRRVVEGQRLTQAASDIFLGWTSGPGDRHYYIRQLRDWKGSAEVSELDAEGLRRYAQVCGWTLARGHARSGDAVSIAAYCGSGPQLDQAVGQFAMAYAELNREDHAAFAAAIADGRLEATHDV